MGYHVGVLCTPPCPANRAYLCPRTKQCRDYCPRVRLHGGDRTSTCRTTYRHYGPTQATTQDANVLRIEINAAAAPGRSLAALDVRIRCVAARLQVVDISLQRPYDRFVIAGRRPNDELQPSQSAEGGSGRSCASESWLIQGGTIKHSVQTPSTGTAQDDLRDRSVV